MTVSATLESCSIDAFRTRFRLGPPKRYLDAVPGARDPAYEQSESNAASDRSEP